MAYTTSTTAPLGAVTVLRVVDFFYSAKEAVASWNDSRRTRKALSVLTDAQLDDIGLSRADIAKI
ncbi:DUF1127 domain-containing protein [Ruegeria pomeroyi]|uniref:DUF1127 domain-containing protein n=1 Tax=Ruegeria pomeroyi TaxID=89184 RepID=A0A850LEY1_9RHOB|nr:DUF1127 domain-containing protein [Ruegeria pomeroyi]NVK96035.1 DUF1127 domain-containing protein [Ruegeria pomeroyi]NVK99905.1 DUF1127 domain-containing protein [Ruegeria pomeroyi]QWV10616.1 DUF1127 domain-containing protein [Ruegeria pomeroyi]HCE72508.1 DUF1127 domain-containing protein [Ruegeria sp.]